MRESQLTSEYFRAFQDTEKRLCRQESAATLPLNLYKNCHFILKLLLTAESTALWTLFL